MKKNIKGGTRFKGLKIFFLFILWIVGKKSQKYILKVLDRNLESFRCYAYLDAVVFEFSVF